MTELSGAQWCARYPTSVRLEDLVEPFQANARRFIQALRDAGTSVTISATYRPAERAYLMHWCCHVAQGVVVPSDVPSMLGVGIDWTHGGNIAAARQAAQAMMAGYNIAYPAALVSRHTQRRAIDMTIHWAGAVSIKDARGMMRPAAAQVDLWPIGASYGVKKLASDPPHWSDDGH